MRKIGIILVIALTLVRCSTKKSENSIYSLIISKDEKVLKESYFSGKTKNDLVNVQSITKSVVSLLIGIAIEEKYLQSEDIPIYTFFPKDSALFSEDKKKITLKHLLNHTSGLKWDGYKEHNSFLKSPNPTKYVLEKELVALPGQTYNYNSGGTHLLSVIIEKVTDKTTLEYANENLFQPLLIETLDWKKLNDGIYDGAGFGLSMKPIDLVKIGELLYNNGSYLETDVLSKTWIEKSKDNNEKLETKWGLRNSKHGYGWYSATINEIEIYYSMGYGGQFILVIPAKKMVIVSTHNSDTPNGIGQQVDFIKNYLPSILDKYDS